MDPKDPKDLKYGTVRILHGELAGELGYYDDDDDDDDENDLAIVYLFRDGGPFNEVGPRLIPPAHLCNDVSMEMEKWVQRNPVLAAKAGIPSHSGIERHVSTAEVIRPTAEAKPS